MYPSKIPLTRLPEGQTTAYNRLYNVLQLLTKLCTMTERAHPLSEPLQTGSEILTGKYIAALSRRSSAKKTIFANCGREEGIVFANSRGFWIALAKKNVFANSQNCSRTSWRRSTLLRIRKTCFFAKSALWIPPLGFNPKVKTTNLNFQQLPMNNRLFISFLQFGN